MLQSAALRDASLGRDFKKFLTREIARFHEIRIRWPWRPPKVKLPPARRALPLRAALRADMVE